MQQAVQQELDAVLTRLEKGLAPEVYDRVLQLIASDDSDVATDEPIASLQRLPE